MLMDVTTSGTKNVIDKEGAEKILKYEDFIIEILVLVVRTSKSDTSYNRGNWDHLKIIQKITKQHIRKVLNHITTRNNHAGHCPHILRKVLT
jgi:hypothetical protein